MSDKFLGMSGRTLKPFILNDEIFFASQHFWSDVVFIRDILRIQNLTSDQLLKLSVFAALYESLDLTYFCLDQHDKFFSTNFKKIYKSDYNKFTPLSLYSLPKLNLLNLLIVYSSARSTQMSYHFKS